MSRINQLTITKLPSVISYINKLLIKIKFCNNIELADPYFDMLMHIQNIIAGLIYIEKLPLPKPLQKFCVEFDRIDTQFEREYFFKQIRENNYLLENT